MMNESIASGGGRGKNKRFWTKEEDNALITALSDLNVDPHWKCEHGFRNGYMVRLEEVIGKAMPGCGLKALPHIDSRLKTLVTKFRAIVQMLGTSGFKWDDEKHMISVQRSVYDEYCKVHPNCKNLYGNAFPHFNALSEIYGKGYATGKLAETFVDAIDNMEKSATVQVMIDSSDDEDTIVSGNGNQTVESAPPLKKVKRDNIFEHEESKKETETESASNPELASLQAFMKDMNVHLSTMAKVMSRADEREQQIAEKSETVLDVLLALEGVTPQQALEVAQILTAQSNKLMIFFKCPDALKCMFVKSLLA
ncbi:hypothetical protein KSS87_015753 [Heliosperma pusillum]|nr:hypothetical protein KSS87_015753 [Heliosperma pusillum]